MKTCTKRQLTALAVTLLTLNLSVAEALTGATGPAGPRGPAGAQGLKGATGNAGVAGPAGAQGLKGATGNAGVAGPAGAQGLKGATGNAGVAGPAGAQGLKGATGNAGVAGPAGAQGLKGATGNAGVAGPAGAQGLKGAAGNAGATGSTGPQGLIGPQGITGAVGSTGAKGIAGAAGIIGLKGDVGNTGASGVQGLIGPQGIKGATGNAGATGSAGPQGVVGPRGAAGVPQAGNDVGDMQYWDGTAWVIIPAPLSAPVAPLMATLHLCNGIPSWEDSCVPPNATVFHIGDNGPAGGKVFYVTDAGLHGLEAAPADQSSGAAWGCYGFSLSGADGTAVGTGAANTADIVAGCADTAAKIADAYALNGYTDWYLPSIDELNLLYQQKTVVGGFANDFYWSSSEHDSHYAWSQHFYYSNQDYYYKDLTLPVRAVRAF